MTKLATKNEKKTGSAVGARHRARSSGRLEGPKASTVPRASSAHRHEVAAPPPAAFAVGTPTRSKTQLERGDKERAAMRSVGLDLGKKEVSFCEVRGGAVTGRRTARGLDGLLDLLGPGTPKARVAIEACRDAWHIHDVLTKHGHDVLVIDTTRVRQLGIGAHGRKTDRLDAECFARAVEERRIPLAHVLSPHRRALREKLNARRTLVETRAQYITSIRGVIRARGEKLASCDTNSFRAALQGATIPKATT